MAILHRAQLTPTKLELLAAWLPRQRWCAGATGPLEVVGSYRFDDPAGEVGIETFLLRAGAGPVMQVPLTYRGAPLEGAGPWLVGTMQHSVLGPRWCYDACGDPVYASVLAMTILEGDTEAEQYFESEGRRELREATAVVRGSGAPGAHPSMDLSEKLRTRTDGGTTVIDAGGRQLTVRRVVDPEEDAGAGHTLTGTWEGQTRPVVLAGLA